MIDIAGVLPENTKEVWEFNGENFYRIRVSNALPDFNSDTIDRGWYQINGGILSTSMNIDGCGDPAYNTDWMVKKLNNDIMILLSQTDNNFMYKEFIKH